MNQTNEERIREQALAICEALYNKKALDIVALNVADKTIIADWFVVCSGRVSAQVKALCDEVEKRAPEIGLAELRREGYSQGRWIVIDYGAILVHVFHPEERAYYNMERLWMDDPRHFIAFSRQKGDA